MITMRLLVLGVLLSGVLTIENPGGPVEESLVTEPSAVQDGPNPSIVEDGSSEQNKLVAEKGAVVNVSKTSVKIFSDASIEESSVQDDEDGEVPNLSDAELKMPLTTMEKEKALKEDREYLLTQDEEKVEKQTPMSKAEAVKPMTYESKNEMSSSSQGEAVKLPNQKEEEGARVKLLTKEVWVIDPSIRDLEEEKESTLDEEKVNKLDNETSPIEDAEEMPLDEEESLTKDSEGVNKPLSQNDEEAKALFEALWEDVNEEGNTSNFAEEPEGDQQNVTIVPVNKVDMEIASVPHMGHNENLQDDDSYTMFVFEEDDDEDAMSQSQEEYDNADTWLIFEEEKVEDDEDETSYSQEEHDEMTWLADEDDSNESMKRNSTVLISLSQDEANKAGVQDHLEGTDEDAAPNAQGVFDEILYQDRNNGIETGFDFSEQKNRNSQKEETLSSHFYAYLVATAIIVIILYAVYHNNGKIIAFVMEKRSKGGWRASDANYQSLDNKV